MIDPLPQEPKAVKSCDYCLGMHDGADCSKFLADVNKLEISSSVDDEYKYEYEPKSPVYSETGDGEVGEEPAVCDMCCGEHSIFNCPNYYYYHVPQYAQVGPFYQIQCQWCRCEIENDLFCPLCRKVVPGCIERRYCKNCGGDLSSNCCANPERFETRKWEPAPSTVVQLSCLPEIRLPSCFCT